MSAPKSKANDKRAANKRLTADQVKLFWRASGQDLEKAEANGNGHVDEANKPIPQINAQTLKQRLDNKEDLFILDVRNPEEWEIANLEDVSPITFIPKPQILIAADEISSGRKRREDTVIGRIPRDREVIVHCRSGARSTDVIKVLRGLGYSADRLVNMEGGILAWSDQVDSSVPKY